MMIDAVGTGKNIKFFRECVGVTVKQVAESTGVSERAVFKWQSGCSVPSIDNLVVLAKMFDCTIDQIVSVNQ